MEKSHFTYINSISDYGFHNSTISTSFMLADTVLYYMINAFVRLMAGTNPHHTRRTNTALRCGPLYK